MLISGHEKYVVGRNGVCKLVVPTGSRELKKVRLTKFNKVISNGYFVPGAMSRGFASARPEDLFHYVSKRFLGAVVVYKVVEDKYLILELSLTCDSRLKEYLNNKSKERR